MLIPPEQAPAAELLLDLVLNPALAEDAFELERDVVLEEIAQYEDQPDEQVLQQTLTGLSAAPTAARSSVGRRVCRR